jgi:hypothetical protein
MGGRRIPPVPGSHGAEMLHATALKSPQEEKLYKPKTKHQIQGFREDVGKRKSGAIQKLHDCYFLLCRFICVPLDPFISTDSDVSWPGPRANPQEAKKVSSKEVKRDWLSGVYWPLGRIANEGEGGGVAGWQQALGLFKGCQMQRCCFGIPRAVSSVIMEGRRRGGLCGLCSSYRLRLGKSACSRRSSSQVLPQFVGALRPLAAPVCPTSLPHGLSQFVGALKPLAAPVCPISLPHGLPQFVGALRPLATLFGRSRWVPLGRFGAARPSRCASCTSLKSEDPESTTIHRKCCVHERGIIR